MRRALCVLLALLASGCGESPRGHKDAGTPPSDDRPNAANGSGPTHKIDMH